ncbi:NAD-dependent epimerase/dehydratase family protein [Pseudanabaena sp. FACHB-1998]|uniref:NAD-dependent epimerase/dehydratase family protein n=1 Tax=Pseudanabaena sp. FACHB-1998 TaxID=2692858 RepID=UPI0016801CD7|nr:NAD-dependent epimerase/dehydratase family protein [Pseudanabaena sp. FACHB-1998]MBD2178230.1 NAD-dependent epimerase/dehydratase family protein [Pseudanabaena sp. FACHB-1998]
MSIVLVTGSAGLIGSESVHFFCKLGFTVVGIDNDMRQVFFGKEASTQWNRDSLIQSYGNQYIHHNVDIRNHEEISQIFKTYNKDIALIIHTAAQPSHDWAASDPYTDFSVNANGTLVLLENTRQNCPDASFIFCSTNKVYGDTPNNLPLIELEKRWEIDDKHFYLQGIDENMSIDASKHSLFGASKVAADILVQEYGRYFNIKTACFRGGCLTGPSHSGTKLHGFLSYLMKCTMTGNPYQIYGYKGKQVRDNIHSYDLVNAFYNFYQAPRIGEVYNIGGSRYSNCSMLEAVQKCEEIADKKLDWSYVETNRSGDHIWWISDIQKFKKHYPNWHLKYGISDILQEIYFQNLNRWI